MPTPPGYRIIRTDHEVILPLQGSKQIAAGELSTSVAMDRSRKQSRSAGKSDFGRSIRMGGEVTLNCFVSLKVDSQSGRDVKTEYN